MSMNHYEQPTSVILQSFIIISIVSYDVALFVQNVYAVSILTLLGDRYGSARWSGSCLSITVSLLTTVSTSCIMLTGVTGNKWAQRTHFYEMPAAINCMLRIFVQLPTSTGAPSVQPACYGSNTGRNLRQSNALNVHTPPPSKGSPLPMCSYHKNDTY
jgi:hypothetical protein